MLYKDYMIEEIFLKNLKQLMEQRGFKSQASFGAEIGVSRATVNKWFMKNNLPAPEIINKINEHFKLEPDELFRKDVIRSNEFQKLCDEIMSRCPEPIEVERYYKCGGANAYVHRLRNLYENHTISFEGWNYYLHKELKKYYDIKPNDLIKQWHKEIVGDSND